MRLDLLRDEREYCRCTSDWFYFAFFFFISLSCVCMCGFVWYQAVYSHLCGHVQSLMQGSVCVCIGEALMLLTTLLSLLHLTRVRGSCVPTLISDSVFTIRIWEHLSVIIAQHVKYYYYYDYCPWVVDLMMSWNAYSVLLFRMHTKRKRKKKRKKREMK